MHLFLLDDDELNNNILKSVLPEIQGVRTFSIYTDGWEALEFLEECRCEDSFPDLMFVDLKMPAMDGEEFVKKYEETFYHSYPQTRLIILSNSIINKEKDNILKYESVNSFIVKPLDFEHLREVFAFEEINDRIREN